MKHRPIPLLVVLLLSLAFMLAGCSGDSVSQDGSTDSSESPSDSTSSEEPVDYEKYNSYIDLMNGISEMDGMVINYFSVVKDQPEFELLDGMDYSMLEDTFQYFGGRRNLMWDAIEASDKEPDYPEQDELLEPLKEPFFNMDDALIAIAEYFESSSGGYGQDEVFRFEEDNMAQAQELHTQLYNAVEPFYETATPFVKSMNELAMASEQEELDRLQADGLNIAYYSRVLINVCTEINTDILEQVMMSESLSALDMTNLETLYAQYQDAHSKLTEAMADPAEVEKIPGWLVEPEIESYSNVITDIDTALNGLMETSRNQGDYTQYYLDFADSVSILIDLYNRDIAL